MSIFLKHPKLFSFDMRCLRMQHYICIGLSLFEVSYACLEYTLNKIGFLRLSLCFILESRSLLQLLLEGNYEAVLLSKAVQDIFTTPEVTEEDTIASYLEKQIQDYLDCSSADTDPMER